MSTSGETPFDFKRGLRPNDRSALAQLAANMERRHGPPRALAIQPEGVIASAASKLAASGGDLGPLDPRETKGAIELAWRKPGPWSLGPRDVEAWLRWAESEWRPSIAATRIGVTLLRHYDPNNPATAIVSDWLAARENLLWGRFGVFARRWALMRGEAAIEHIVLTLATGDLSFFHDAEQFIRAKIILRGSGFVAGLAAHFGRACPALGMAEVRPAVENLLAFLVPRGQEGSSHVQKAARLSLLCGVVEMAARIGGPDAVAFALDVAFQLAGDPRVTLDDWRDAPEPIVEQVEAWLVERTLDAAFQIIDELKTDDVEEWRRRQAFWRAYLPHIRRARLLCAPKARRVAERLKEPCCVLHTYLADHCGVLLELQGPEGARLVVVEINNRAQAMFWPDGQAAAPSFQHIEFDGSQMRTHCRNFLSHLPPDAWPDKFAKLIEEHAGVRIPFAVAAFRHNHISYTGIEGA